MSEELEEKPKNIDPEFPKQFIMSSEGVVELTGCINAVVANKYARQAIFDCININLKRVE